MGRIHLSKVSKSFGGVSIIPELDLDIGEGEFVVFVGPSGCGKSTLLRLIAGLEDLSGGTISIDGVDVTNEPPAKRGLSMVFQSYALYPHMSVYGNIAFPLKMAGEDKATIDHKVTDAARILNLTDYLDRKPRQLSGGQRQRVAIGRAIVREPTRLPVRRAALQSRRRAARRHAAGDHRAASSALDDDDLRHPRPDRGHDHGRPHRGAERGPHRAGRLAAGAVQKAGQSVRRRLHRLAEDEHRQWRPGSQARRGDGRRAPGAYRAVARQLACGRARSASPSIWARTPSCISAPTASAR